MSRRPVMVGLMILAAAGCDRSSPSGTTTRTSTPEEVAVRVGLDEAVVRRAMRASPVPPPPADSTNRVADDATAADFGRTLFFDPGLSGRGDVSCATCHRPELHFTDGLPLSRGVATAGRHAPTLVDAAHQRWFNWDGRSDSMWAHAIRPIEHPDEMGGDRTAVVRHLLEDPERRATYEAIFEDPLPELDSLPERARPGGNESEREAWAAMPEETRLGIDRVAANVGKAMAAYQRTLQGGTSSFDDWVAEVAAGGDGSVALDPSQRRGLELFFGRAECWECHAGPLFTDGEFHNIGTPVPGGLPRDPGRYDGAALVVDDRFNAAGLHSDDQEGARAIVSRGVKRDPSQWGAFRTPSLRHVGRTAPYMHDGSMPDLETVVRFYSTLEGAIQLDHHQESVLAPLDLSDGEIADLVAFLRSLDGDIEFVTPGPLASDNTKD
ncbi:MAG: methylamine utilization protein [Phycisphaerae bacterium]|nr:methylamine utilization protein [Phycisphaerae bacterium]